MTIVKLNYTLITPQDGKAVDTTVEKIAKENGFYNKDVKYNPITIILGEKELLPALEEKIKTMKPKEEKEFLLKSEEAFGERNPQLIRVIPEKEFKEKKMQPFPGMVLQLGNAFGIVQSISSGRVRVDFNNPLAGKDVKYKVELIEEIKDKEKILDVLKEKLFGKNKIEIKEEKGDIEIKTDSKIAIPREIKAKYSELAKKHAGIKKIVFIEEF